MILNDVLMKQSVLNEVILGENMSTSTKVKIMRIRSAYSKVRLIFDEEIKTFAEQLVPQELKDLTKIEEKTSEELEKFNTLFNKMNLEYQEYLTQKGLESVEIIEDSFTEEEFSEILEANLGREIVINNNPISIEQFLEIIYGLFVK